MEGVECVCVGRGRMCVYGRGGVCVHREREDMCIWKGLSVRASGEGRYVYMEGVECACMGRGTMKVYVSVCQWWFYSLGGLEHPATFSVPSPGICMDVCIWKGWSVRARGEGGCVYMKEWSVHARGEGGCVI